MERANAVAAAMAQKEREMAEHGRKHAYADWLQPLVSANRLEMSTVETSSADASAGSPVPARRGRGRPRVTKPRDPSAIEVSYLPCFGISRSNCLLPVIANVVSNPP